MPLPSTWVLACIPVTQGRLCQFRSLRCRKMLLNDTNKHGVPLPQGIPRTEENESEKHFPLQRKDASSKQDAPHVAWQRLGAPGKPTCKQIASACQFTSPVDLQVCPQSSQLSSPAPRAGGPSWQKTPAAPLSPANASSRLLCPC